MSTRSDVRLAQARWAVGVWADFPVHQVPRPVVLVDGDVRVTDGWRTGEARDAFEAGRIDWQADVPTGVQDVVQCGATAEPAAPRMVITDAGRDEFSFLTDRGPTALPAWRLEGPDTLGPIWVLDPAIERWEPADGAGGVPPAPPTQIPPLWSPIEIDPTGKEITFSWLQESPPGETILRVDGIETDTAVSLAVIVEPLSPEPGVGYTLQGFTRRITAWLDAPLGPRVCVGLHGEAIEVIPAGSSSKKPFPTSASVREVSHRRAGA
jgi:hypothetical protein